MKLTEKVRVAYSETTVRIGLAEVLLELGELAEARAQLRAAGETAARNGYELLRRRVRELTA